MADRTFKQVKRGELFEILYDCGEGVLLKLSDVDAVRLSDGQIQHIAHNKKVTTPPRLGTPEKMGRVAGRVVILAPYSADRSIAYEFVIIAAHLVDNAHVQGLEPEQPPYDKNQVDIILTQIAQGIKQAGNWLTVLNDSLLVETGVNAAKPGRNQKA